MRTKAIFLFALFCPFISFGQLAPACAGGSPATSCADACINCNFNGYSGSTAGFPSGVVPNFCGTVENAQWMGFIAGKAQAVFTITPSNCSDGNGIQVALYEDCEGMPIDCDKGKENGGNIPVSLDVTVTPGRNYFLMIDGYAGDQCDFTVSVSPADAVYEPPLGMVGAIDGLTKACPGASFTYTVAPVFGAGGYIWDGPPGTLVDSMPVPFTKAGPGSNTVTVTFGDQSGKICVQAANSCSQNPPCSSSLDIEILDDSYRPKIVGDTVANLSCTDTPIAFDVDIVPAANYSYRWTADSTGMIVSGANGPRPQITKTGLYTLVVTNTQNGCSSAQTIRVDEPEPPGEARFTQRNATCYGYDDGSIVIQSLGKGHGPFQYSLDDEPLSPGFVFVNLPPGHRKLKVVSVDECEWDTTFMITEPLELTLELSPDTSVNLGESLHLWNPAGVSEPNRAVYVKIVPEELQAMACENCMYEPLHSFRYHVTVSDSAGCSATDDREVLVANARRYYAPNAFAPENPEPDNIFSLFGGANVEQIRSLQVFNRWGRLVFERLNFDPADPTLGWDGKIDGKPADPAVYVWSAEILYVDGQTERIKGNVTLLR